MIKTQMDVVQLTKTVGFILKELHIQNEVHLKKLESELIEKIAADQGEQVQEKFKELQSLEAHVLTMYTKFNVPSEYHIKLMNRIQRLKIGSLSIPNNTLEVKMRGPL